MLKLSAPAHVVENKSPHDGQSRDLGILRHDAGHGWSHLHLSEALQARCTVVVKKSFRNDMLTKVNAKVDRPWGARIATLKKPLWECAIGPNALYWELQHTGAATGLFKFNGCNSR